MAIKKTAQTMIALPLGSSFHAKFEGSLSRRAQSFRLARHVQRYDKRFMTASEKTVQQRSNFFTAIALSLGFACLTTSLRKRSA